MYAKLTGPQLQIPCYAIYRLSSFVLPYLGFGGNQGGASQGQAAVAGGNKGVDKEAVAVSKRQSKLAERQKKGPVRVGY